MNCVMRELEILFKMWNVMNCVMRELEILLIHGHQSTKFSEIF